MSIAKNRCPKCHIGAFWPAGPFVNLFTNKGKVFSNCSHCGLTYEKENGFWYGAMFVSYGLGVGVLLATWAATELLAENLNLAVQISIICSAIVLLSPVNYWISRLIWINLFVGFQSDVEQCSIAPEMVSK